MKSLTKESWIDRLRPSNKNTIIQKKFRKMSLNNDSKEIEDKLNLSHIEYINTQQELSLTELSIYDHEDTMRNLDHINKFIEEKHQIEITENFFLKKTFHSIIPFFLVSDRSVHRLTLSDYEIKIICKEHCDKSKIRRESVDNYKIGIVNFYRGRFDLAYLKFKNAYESNNSDINLSKWLCFTILILLNPDIVKGKKIQFDQVNLTTPQGETKISFFKCCSTRKTSLPLWEGDAEIPSNEVLTGDLVDIMRKIEKRMESDPDLNLVEFLWLQLIMTALSKVNPVENNFDLNQDYKTYLSKIKKIDPYLSYIAYGEYHYITDKKYDYFALLSSLVSKYPNRVEAYMKLWTLLTNKKSRWINHNLAYNLCETFALHNSTFHFDQHYPTYAVYNTIMYIKSSFRVGYESKAINKLQKEYPSNFMFPCLYLLTGKYLAKSNSIKQKVAAAGILNEAVRLLYNDTKKVAYFWLGKIYFDLNRFDLCFTYWNEYSVGNGKTSINKATITEDFIKWYLDSSYSLETIKNIPHSRKKLPLNFYLDCIDRINKDDSMINVVYKASCYFYVLRNLQKSSKILMSVIDKKKFLMEAHQLMWKIIKHHKDYILLLKYSSLIVKLAHQDEVTTGNWTQSLIYYAKALALNGKHEEALELLRNLLDLYPNIPIDNLKYLNKVYQENKRFTTNFIPSTESALSLYSRYHVYKISEYLLHKTSRKSSTQGSINSKDESYLSKQTTFKSDISVIPCTDNCDNQGLNDIADYIDSNINSVEITSKSECTKLINILDLNIISDPMILYQMAKICAKGDYKWELGILCLRDFLKLLKFESNYMLDTAGERKRFKAYFWFGLLYVQMKDYK